MKKIDSVRLLTMLISPIDEDLERLQDRVAKLSSSDWEEIIKIANVEGVIPLLHISLQRKDLKRFVEDEELLGYIEAFYLLNEKRNLEILEQLEEMNQLFKEIDLTPIYLKGAAALSEKHYQTIGERLMTDIDIAVDYDRVMEGVSVLKDAGYKELFPEHELLKEWHHYKRLYRDDVAASLELHRTILKMDSLQYFPKDEDIYEKSSVYKDVLVISPTYELFYSFLHTQISHQYHYYYYLSIRHLQHFCVIAKKYQVDFELLEDLAKQHKIEDKWYAYLLMQNYFFGLEIDEKIKENIEAKSYLQKIVAKIEGDKSFITKIKVFIRKSIYALSYVNIRKFYQFESRWMLLYYVPRRIISLLFSYMKSTKKRKKLYESIDHLSS